MDNAIQKAKLCPVDGSQCDKACPNYKGSRNCSLFNLSQQCRDSFARVLEAGEISSQNSDSYLSPETSLKIHANGFAKQKLKTLKSNAAGNTEAFDTVEEFLSQACDGYENTAPPHSEQPQHKTSFDRIRESGRRLISALVCGGVVVIIVLLIIGSFVS